MPVVYWRIGVLRSLIFLRQRVLSFHCYSLFGDEDVVVLQLNNAVSQNIFEGSLIFLSLSWMFELVLNTQQFLGVSLRV